MSNTLKRPVVVIGIGEIGSVFARGLLRCGHPVYPVTRDMDLQTASTEINNPEAVIVAVGESELQTILSNMPANWKDKLVLIQNELLPKDWQPHHINPTVISVWFEKKKGQDVKVVVASPIYGKHSQLIADALSALDIPNVIINDAINDEDQMTFELVRKNYYILLSNIAGLRVGGTVSELWRNHQDFAKEVLSDIHALQESMVGEPLDNQALTDAMLIAFEGDPDHGCMGRSAPARLKRALAIARDADIDVPMLKQIAYEQE